MDSLIKLLKGNARLSNEQLAVMLGVTPEEVAARIADYEKRGVYGALPGKDLQV